MRPPTHPDDLDPSLVDQHTYVSRRRQHLLDVAALLSLTLALVILVRADLVVPQMTGNLGRPALLLGMALTAGWVVSKLHPRLAVRGPQPLRWAGGVYLSAVLLAYAAGTLRGLPALEAGGADRALIATVIFLGVAIACADGVRNRARLDDVMRMVVWLGAVMGLIGLVQFTFRFNLVDLIDVPGLVSRRGEAIGFRERGGDFIRVASTANHYIEFSTVMAMSVPIAIHHARFGLNRLTRQLAAIAAVIMVAAIPVTLSRSGMLALLVGMVVLAPFWNWRTRLNIATIGMTVIVAIMFIRPGLLGTIRSLFTQTENDPSIESRTEARSDAFAYFAERPLFGRGPGTFIPSIYRYLDNEWLMHLVTTGLVGTAALAAWHVTALILAVIAYRRASREHDRHLCASLIAVQVMAMLAAGTFDAMSFSTHTTLLAVLTGAAGAMWRFTHPARRVRSAASLPLPGNGGGTPSYSSIGRTTTSPNVPSS